MTNRLAQAAQELQRRMVQDASELVTYKRPNSFAFDVSAIVGRSVVEQDSGQGFMLRVVSRDFTISQEALNYTLPQRNDIIVQTINDVTLEFLVDGGPGQSHFEETDGYGVAWRIHTKRNKASSF